MARRSLVPHTFRLTCAFQTTSTAALGGGAAVSGGNLTCSQNLDVQGSAHVGGNLNVDAGITVAAVQTTGSGGGDFAGALHAGGATTLDSTLSVGSTCALHGAVHCYATLTVDGAMQVGGPTTLAGSLHVNGAATFDIACSFGSGTLVVGTSGGSLTNPITTSNAGRVIGRAISIPTDADQNLGISDFDTLRVPAGLLTADRNLTLNTTGANPGDVVTVFSENTGFHLRVYDSVSGSVLSTLINTSGSTFSVQAIYMAGQWRLRSLSRVP